MKKKNLVGIVTAVLLLAGGLCAQAQSNDEQKQKIYSIKKDQNYIYADVTSETKNQAVNDAESMLFERVNHLASEKQLKPATGATIKSKTGQITMPRGNMYRAFVYVKASDAIQGIRPTPSQPVVSSQPSPSTGTTNPHRTVVVEQLLKLTKGTELENCLKSLKQQGHIESYNTYRNIGDPSQYLLVIYNREGNIEAVLSEGSERTNLRTGKSDNVSNYSGRGAMGVKVRKQ